MFWTRLCGMVAILSAGIGYCLLAWPGYLYPSWWIRHGITPPDWFYWTMGMREVWWCFFVALTANCLGHVFAKKQQTESPASRCVAFLHKPITSEMLHTAVLLIVPFATVAVMFYQYHEIRRLEPAIENYRRILKYQGQFPYRSFVLHEKVMDGDSVAFFKVPPGSLELEIIEYDVDASMRTRKESPLQAVSTATHGTSLSSLYEQLKERRLRVEEEDRKYLEQKRKGRE